MLSFPWWRRAENYAEWTEQGVRPKESAWHLGVLLVVIAKCLGLGEFRTREVCLAPTQQ